MARPNIPPRGFYIPTHMLFKSQMPPAVFVTWLQLHSLTWRGADIPALLLKEWVDLTGTSRSTLIRHLNWLKRMNALRWHSPEPGTICVTFKDAHLFDENLAIQDCWLLQFKHACCPKMDSSKMNSSKMNSPKMDIPPSLNPPLDSNSINIPVIESGDQESNHIPEQEGEGEGEGESERERGFCARRAVRLSNLSANSRDPVSIYRSVVHLTPNLAQRRLLSSQVTDLLLWQQTVEHWASHGWNPRNVNGMLELYARRGPPGCRYCREPHKSTRVAKTDQEASLAALDELRQELGPSSQTDER